MARREPQLAEARAMVKSAQAGLARARIDLDRTSIRSPFPGRIRARFVDDGQFVTAGTPIATIYSTDFAEIRVAISPAELAYVDLPLGEVIDDPERGLTATVYAEYGRQTHEWAGYVARTEGEVEESTQMLHAIIRVPHPYGQINTNGDGHHAPLLIGSFVTARIDGRRLETAAEIPRRALIERTKQNERVWTALIVDSENKLRLRPVQVMRLAETTAIIGSGLATGEKLCISPLAVPIDGMQLRIVTTEDPESEPVGAER